MKKRFAIIFSAFLFFTSIQASSRANMALLAGGATTVAGLYLLVKKDPENKKAKTVTGAGLVGFGMLVILTSKHLPGFIDSVLGIPRNK